MYMLICLSNKIVSVGDSGLSFGVLNKEIYPITINWQTGKKSHFIQLSNSQSILSMPQVCFSPLSQ